MKKLVMLLMLLLPTVTQAQYDARVVGRDWLLSPRELPTRYRRAYDPISGQIKYLINERGEICLVSDSDFVMVKNDDIYKCNNWRKPRGI